MKRVFSWVLLLFLAGCQTTQPDSVTTDEKNFDLFSVDETTASSNKEEPRKETLSSISVSQNESNARKRPVTTPWDQEDIWDRIGMQLNMPIPQHRKIEYYRDWYIKHPNHLRAVSQRAEPFLYLIVEEIENRHLPLELALLPIVESSFDPFAYSHGSAAGLWQFVPGTGRMYGLEQNYWYDGRRDVKAATSAALSYLESLNTRFDGDWSHAIAAYNSGGGRVSRAIKKNKSAGKPTDFFSLDLPKETSSYVPKLLALADIVKNQEKYGVAIPSIANTKVVEQVDPGEQLDIAVAANYAGMKVGDLQKLNPAYNQWATPPEGPHYFLLPVEQTKIFVAKAEENRGKGVRVVRYKVKTGDSLSVIARKHNTTSDNIRVANHLKGNFIRAGQHLMIPVSSKENQAYEFSAQNRLQKTQSVARGKYRLTHTVSKGDNLWSIARKHKVSYQSLAKWNGMGPRDTLRIGQKLVIWQNSSDGSIIRTVHYKVRNGDTLSGIANKFRVKTVDILKWNNLSKNNYIRPGQQIKLYVDVTKVSV